MKNFYNNFLLIIFIISFFTCCSKGKLIQRTDTTLALKSNTDLFLVSVRNISNERRKKQKDIDSSRNLVTLVEDVDRNLYKLEIHDKNKVVIDQFRKDYDILCSSLSYNSDALLIKMQNTVKRGKKSINNISLFAYSLISNNYKEIYSYEKTSTPYYADIFPNIVWDRYSNSFAFIGEDNGYAEIFVGFYYDNDEIAFDNFKITDNRNREIYYFDITWSPSGDRIAFTEYNEKAKTFDVKIFNLLNQRYEKHKLDNDIACFRFSNVKDNSAFFVKKSAGLFYPFHTDNYLKDAGAMIPKAFGLTEPLFISNYAFLQNRLAYVSLNDDSFILSIYCFDTENHYQSEVFTYRDPKLPFIVNNGPVWLFDDNFVILHDILQKSTLYYCFVNNDFLKMNSDASLLLNIYLQDKILWYLNSVTTSSDGKKFSLQGFDNRAMKKDIFFIEGNIIKQAQKLDEIMVSYKTTIDYLGTNDSGEHVIQLTRRKKNRRTDVSNIGKFTSKKDFFYYNPDRIEEDKLIKGGKNFNIEWPATVKDKQVVLTITQDEIEQPVGDTKH